MPLVVSPNVSPTHRSKNKNNSGGGSGSGMNNTIKLLGFGLLCFAAGIHLGRGSTVFSISGNNSGNSNNNAVEVGDNIATPSTTREKPHRLFAKENNSNNNNDDGSTASSSSATAPPSSAIDTTVVNNNHEIDEEVDEEIIISMSNDNNNNEKNNKQYYDKPVEKIVILGERHSGTNWIEDYLRECFDVEVTPHYKRFKHWFQEDDLNVIPENSAVVVSLFRDPYDWVWAMRFEPHHAHDHLDWHDGHPFNFNASKWWHEMAYRLDWKDFVTKPWMGKRGPTDNKLIENGETDDANCMDSYTFVDAAPCSVEDAPKLMGLGEYKYEFKHDGSETGFSSILELRRDKIINHLSVADMMGARSYHPYQFENLKDNGTAVLLKDMEEALGLKPKCDVIYGKLHRHDEYKEKKRLEGQQEEAEEEKNVRRRQLLEKAISKKRVVPEELVQYMNTFVDWDVESRIGYSKREV